MSPINGDDDYGTRITHSVDITNGCGIFHPFYCWDQNRKMTTEKKPFFIGSYHRIFDYLSKPHTMNFVKRREKLWKYERSLTKGI